MGKFSECALALALISSFVFLVQVQVVSSDVQPKDTIVQKLNDTDVKPTAFVDSGKNCTSNETSQCHEDSIGVFQSFLNNRDMLMRTMYVLFAVTGIVVVYFVVRAFRLHIRRSKSRKYGVITTRGDMEMEPLGQGGDEEEDYTVFEVNGKHK